MRTPVIAIAAALALFHAAPAIAQPAQPDLNAALASAGVDTDTATFIARRLEDGAEWVVNADRSAIRFPPASTSKIPHTLIALETGFADPDTHFEWDGRMREFDVWNQDQTMTSAFRVSAVWVYQRMTATLGGETMAAWLDRFDYGNETIGGEADLTQYWLDGPLEISAREQVDFLERLALDRLPVSADTMAQARGIMQVATGEDDRGPWTLYAKTGWRFRDAALDTGWYVGWVERPGETWAFALNMDMPERADVARRRPAAIAALIALDVLPEGAE